MGAQDKRPLCSQLSSPWKSYGGDPWRWAGSGLTGRMREGTHSRRNSRCNGSETGQGSLEELQHVVGCGCGGNQRGDHRD